MTEAFINGLQHFVALGTLIDRKDDAYEAKKSNRTFSLFRTVPKSDSGNPYSDREQSEDQFW